jgi:hypothetical protein
MWNVFAVHHSYTCLSSGSDIACTIEPDDPGFGVPRTVEFGDIWRAIVYTLAYDVILVPIYSLALSPILLFAMYFRRRRYPSEFSQSFVWSFALSLFLVFAIEAALFSVVALVLIFIFAQLIGTN